MNSDKIIKEGERKMKYELKNNGRSWWVKGMVVEGEIDGRTKILEINSIDICKLNVDIMTKEQIIECMEYPRCGFGEDYLKEIKPTFTMLEKLLLEHQLEMGYKYITRDETDNRLNFFSKINLYLRVVHGLVKMKITTLFSICTLKSYILSFLVIMKNLL